MNIVSEIVFALENVFKITNIRYRLYIMSEMSDNYVENNIEE